MSDLVVKQFMPTADVPNGALAMPQNWHKPLEEMTIDDIVPERFMTKKWLRGLLREAGQRELLVTVTNVSPEWVPDGDNYDDPTAGEWKTCLSLAEKPDTFLVINKSRALMMAETWTRFPINWIGAELALFVDDYDPKSGNLGEGNSQICIQPAPGHTPPHLAKSKVKGLRANGKTVSVDDVNQELFGK